MSPALVDEKAKSCINIDCCLPVQDLANLARRMQYGTLNPMIQTLADTNSIIDLRSSSCSSTLTTNISTNAQLSPTAVVISDAIHVVESRVWEHRFYNNSFSGMFVNMLSENLLGVNQLQISILQ